VSQRSRAEKETFSQEESLHQGGQEEKPQERSARALHRDPERKKRDAPLRSGKGWRLGEERGKAFLQEGKPALFGNYLAFEKGKRRGLLLYFQFPRGKGTIDGRKKGGERSNLCGGRERLGPKKECGEKKSLECLERERRKERGRSLQLRGGTYKREGKSDSSSRGNGWVERNSALLNFRKIEGERMIFQGKCCGKPTLPRNEGKGTSALRKS